MFAIASDIFGIMLSVLLCTIILFKKLWSDPLFVFILCYFVSEIIHSFAYMFSIVTDCFLTIAINELICRSVEIMILFSGMTAGIWLCLNGIVRMIYFVYPFKYVTICKIRNCVIAILISVITILLYTLIMGGFPYRLPAFTNDCRKAEKMEFYRIIMIIYFIVSILIQLYCPYRIWRLMKTQRANQNASFIPQNITHVMSFQRQKTFRMLIFISSGLWIFYFPVIFLELFTQWYIKYRLKEEVTSNNMETSVLYTMWPFVETICKITQHTVRPVVSSLCILVSCPPIKHALRDWKRTLLRRNESSTNYMVETEFWA